ncbi:NUDIX domain-containing protein [Curtobacterium sp. MCPF17_002]|uniref:NUDIX hydrolase n=1 Tax=Curtobacterium sp. MCPF17_002 TaxID=2175645 RepID=UPI000DA96970|nr:NUDIX domain-containing protein [Curtobacterium sp. MCPF17_002]WIB79002.1 NUDIX domain-containing protein [Curtobacterium sp. MCPF17_002]
MPSIRNIAIGLPVKDGHVLVSASSDRQRDLDFYRAVGGGIEFGERADEALRREFREELDVALDHVELLGVIENIFEFEGQPGHEYAHVFAVHSDELDDVPLDAELVVLDEGSPVRWAPLDTLVPVFPEGVLEMLRSAGGRPLGTPIRPSLRGAGAGSAGGLRRPHA